MSPDDLVTLQALAAGVPQPPPACHLVWTAVVDIGDRQALGPGPLGERAIVPITGGRFWGGPGHAALQGRVRADGADRQLWRADGVKELVAVYEMQCDDGTVLSIDNRALVDDQAPEGRYCVGRLFVAAPDGPHGWLNRRVLVATVQPLRPARAAVLVRAWRVDPLG